MPASLLALNMVIIEININVNIVTTLSMEFANAETPIYVNDCLKHFEHVIDPQQHIFTFTSKLNTDNITTQTDTTNKTNKTFTNLNLKQSLLNQTDWMKNILKDIEFYKNENNINSTINEYIQFMKLISNTNKIMIPSVAIDLIWHTHMLYPLIYYKEFHILANKFVFHNDFLKDESQEKYWQDWVHTKSEWNKHLEIIKHRKYTLKEETMALTLIPTWMQLTENQSINVAV